MTEKSSNIVLVDDDEVYLFIATKILKLLSKKLSVQTFTDGERAMDFIKRKAGVPDPLPEVILLDINMPYMDGWGFLREFQKLRPNITKEVQIYLVTSSENPDEKRRADEFGLLTGYIVKPISKNKLKSILTEVYDENFDIIK